MHCPTLEQLPPPPIGKTGWPWTVANPQSQDADSLPKLSVVTPSYNQAQFIEETLRSVLLQGYPNLDYIVIDGGSKDGSVEIIRKYEPWLTYWVSEPDRGQTNAINKGMRRGAGEIFAWLNSDDVYAAGALSETGRYIISHPTTVVIFGDSDFIDSAGKTVSRFRVQPFRPPRMFFDHFIPQPSAFIRRSALDKAGGLDESLHFCMDYDLWLRIALQGTIDYAPRTWSSYRVHSASKGSKLQALRWAETARILLKFFARPDLPKQWLRFSSQAIGRAHWHAAVEYFRVHDNGKADEHLHQAADSFTNFIATQEFAGMLVGDLATQTTVETFDLIDGFFRLIPDRTEGKQAAFARARARADALIAINNSTPPALARQHARNALWLDPFWISNRHVLRRAMG